MELLTVKDVAGLKGCSEQYVRALISRNKLACEIDNAVNGRPRYLIPVSALEIQFQRKWFVLRGIDPPTGLVDGAGHTKRGERPDKVVKPLEFYTAEEREEIAAKELLLQRWQAFRKKHGGSKAQADADFIRGERLDVSAQTLSRYWLAYKSKDWDALVDKRGKANKGRTDFSQEIRDLFEYFYLDERAVNITTCYTVTRNCLRHEKRYDLLAVFPSYQTVRRWAKEMPLPIACLAREGDKAFDDAYGLFVDRLYDDMLSNDFWIADGHRIDVITRSEDGKERRRRMTFTAFIDARSGIYVGWVITDNPSTEATLLALRKAINRYGIPRYLYVDNGREYLNYDIGGMGHRQKKRNVQINLPTPILTRLGIQMVNALPRNAQAKIIEREFKNFTFLSRLFDTYCGSNVVVKPEKLKYKLKNGQIPTDSELYQAVESMIDGYFNCQEYNGKVIDDRGLTKIQVYHDNLPKQIRKAPEEILNLMMMRSTKLQTVRQNGVYVLVGGEKIYYYDDELLFMAGKKVYVRYDPEIMNEVRVYDEKEAFIRAVPLHPDMMLTYFASKDDLKGAMSEKRRYKRLVKQEIAAKRESIVARYGHVNMLDLLVRISNENREGILISGNTAPPAIELVRQEEQQQSLSATGTDGTAGAEIDKEKIIRNNERRQTL